MLNSSNVVNSLNPRRQVTLCQRSWIQDSSIQNSRRYLSPRFCKVLDVWTLRHHSVLIHASLRLFRVRAKGLGGGSFIPLTITFHHQPSTSTLTFHPIHHVLRETRFRIQGKRLGEAKRAVSLQRDSGRMLTDGSGRS